MAPVFLISLNIFLKVDDEAEQKRRRKRQIVDEVESRIVQTPGVHFCHFIFKKARPFLLNKV